MTQALHLVDPICTILVALMKLLTIIIFCLLFLSCDAGLAPPPPAELGFSGTVYFTPDSWPKDSLISLWIFASQIYPLDSAKVYSGLFSVPNTIFLYPGITQSLPLLEVDSIPYSFPLSSGSYKYVGVIQQVSPDLINLGIRVFRVVGFYKDSTNLSQPGSVRVNDNYQVKGININVDFRNPPLQPF
jgi:hypothetical protein